MSKFRSAPRTIVTEIKSFVVDSVSRSGVFRQSVSARVADSEPLNRQDVNITSERFYEVDDVSSVMGIMSPEDVRVELIQISTSIPPEEPEAPIPDPVFVVNSDIFIGETFNIRLVDHNVESIHRVMITVMCMDTGETEDVQLDRVESGVFEGSIPTNRSTGLASNFDNVLSLNNGSQVLLQYLGADDETYSGYTNAVSPYVDSKVSSIPIVFIGNPLPVVVEDADLAGESKVSVQIMNTTTGMTSIVDLLEFELGSFHGLFDTADSLETGKISVSPGQSLSVMFTSSKYADSPNVEFIVQAKEEQIVPVTLDSDDTVEVGRPLVVSLNDYNRAGVGAIDIIVSKLGTREYVVLRCEEVMPSSGLFYGELETSKIPMTGALKVTAGDVLESVYVETSSAEPVRMTSTSTVVSTIQPEPAGAKLDRKGETEEPSILVENKVDFLVNGLYFFNGEFNGKVRIYGLSSEPVRCSILHS